MYVYVYVYVYEYVYVYVYVYFYVYVYVHVCVYVCMYCLFLPCDSLLTGTSPLTHALCARCECHNNCGFKEATQWITESHRRVAKAWDLGVPGYICPLMSTLEP